MDAIKEFITDHGYSPTIRQFAEMAGTPSTSVSNYYLDRMERMGLIERVPGISRGIIIPGMQEDNKAHTVIVYALPVGLAKRRYRAGIAFQSVRKRWAARGASMQPA